MGNGKSVPHVLLSRFMRAERDEAESQRIRSVMEPYELDVKLRKMGGHAIEGLQEQMVQRRFPSKQVKQA